MKIIIDGDKINDLNSFYDGLEVYLRIGNCPWGRNLDSLHEIIQYNFNYTDNKQNDVTEIIWKNTTRSKIKLGKEETINWLKRKKEITKTREYAKYIDQEIKKVQSGKRQTLFELIIQLIRDYSKINLVLE